MTPSPTAKVTDAMVDQIAETMWQAEWKRAGNGGPRKVPWTEIAEKDRERYRFVAREVAALTAAIGAGGQAVAELHGPFGWLNGHRGLSEESWTLESDPLENSEEYFAIPLYALVDPFKEIGKDFDGKPALAHPHPLPLKEEVERVLEPFARADQAIGDEPGPFHFETGTGYRLIEREDLRAARDLLSRLRAGVQEGDGSRGSSEYYAEKRAREWAVERWNAEVKNRPLVNVHRAGLDTAWRQVIRHFGGDPEMLVGPDHYTLVEQTASPSVSEGGSRS